MHGITTHTEHLTRRYVSREWHRYRKIWRIFSICLIHRNSPSVPAFDGLNYDDVTWESWQYRSKTAWLFVQRRIPVVKKKNKKYQSFISMFLCEGNLSVTDVLPAQRDSSMKSVSMSRRHHKTWLNTRCGRINAWWPCPGNFLSKWTALWEEVSYQDMNKLRDIEQGALLCWTWDAKDPWWMLSYECITPHTHGVSALIKMINNSFLA